jgi:hypothetical protein
MPTSIVAWVVRAVYVFLRPIMDLSPYEQDLYDFFLEDMPSMVLGCGPKAP